MHKIYHGSCLCGEVTFAAEDVSDIWYCHCKQCQHLSGHIVAAAGVSQNNLEYAGDISWSPVSSQTESGHCTTCNSLMFWNKKDSGSISILIGNFADPVGLDVKGHIFVGEKPNYYKISDDLPQYDQYPEGGIR